MIDLSEIIPTPEDSWAKLALKLNAENRKLKEHLENVLYATGQKASNLKAFDCVDCGRDRIFHFDWCRIKAAQDFLKEGK